MIAFRQTSQRLPLVGQPCVMIAAEDFHSPDKVYHGVYCESHVFCPIDGEAAKVESWQHMIRARADQVKIGALQALGKSMAEDFAIRVIEKWYEASLEGQETPYSVSPVVLEKSNQSRLEHMVMRKQVRTQEMNGVAYQTKVPEVRDYLDRLRPLREVWIDKVSDE